MAVRLNIATVYRMVATRSLAIAGNEDVLWPLHGDPKFPKSPATDKHWLFIRALSLTPQPRASDRSPDVYTLALDATLLTVSPKEANLYAHPEQVMAVLGSLAEVSFDDGDAAHEHRISTGRAITRMNERQTVNGRGMASEISISGTVQRHTGSN